LKAQHARTILVCLAALLLWTALFGAAPRLHAQDQVVHVVLPGDTLSSIAQRYGSTVEAIMSANGVTNPDLIYTGQRLVVPGATQAPTAPGPTSAIGSTYVVQWGDTLSGIALRHGVSIWALMQANGLSNARWIYVGQKLTIPGAAGPAPTPTPGPSDTYIVRPGDTLSAIALRFGTSAFELARLNGIVNPSLIYVGQELRLTGAAPAAPPPSSGGAKHIVIYISQQHLYAYEGERLVYSFVCSTGRVPYYTRSGEFAVQSKIPNAYGSTWGIWMPHWLGIYWAGGTENGIHALPIMQNGQTLWAGYLGRPISYGCIVLGTYNAQLLYNWAEIGTPVTIRP